MRAIRIDEWGGPEVMQLVDIPPPKPGEGEVLIEVSHAGVNFADTHQRENNYIARYELPLVPGGEVVGTVRGGALDGRRVVAMTGSGGYAELATAREDTTFPLPDEVDDGQALALLIQGLTAWHLYRTCARIHPGESVVVHSAAGGVDSIAVQLGKPMGAGRVIATASSEEKRQLALELGADLALDPEKDLPGPVDIVFETAGGPLFERSFAALAPFGRIVQYGLSTREKTRVSNANLLKTSRGIVGFWLMHAIGQPGMLREPLADLFERAGRRGGGGRVGPPRRPVRAGRARRGGRARRRGVPAVGGRPRARGPALAPHEREADR